MAIASSTQSEPTKLVSFLPPLTVTQLLERTAKYAKSPRQYLEEVLGPQIVKERESLLSIPEETNRDIYGTGTHKQRFEKHIANLLGKEHGLFFVSGIQAQLAALKVHCEAAKNNRIAWHITAHLESAELKAYKELYGLEHILMGKDPDALPTIAEIDEIISLPPEKRPAVILIETPNRTLGCRTYTFSELEHISAACRAAGIKFHMDGARLWEIEPYYQATAGKSFAELGALFDTVYVSLYKALGGAAGAVLVSNDIVLYEDAKVWQRRAGGGVVTLYYEVLDCERGFNEKIGTFARKRNGMLDLSTRILDATAQYRNSAGNPIVRFIPAQPTCCQTCTGLAGFTEEQLYGARDRVQAQLNLRVFERLRPTKTVDEAMELARMEKLKLNGTKEEPSLVEPEDSRDHSFEWYMQESVEQIDTSLIVQAFEALCKDLLASS